MPSSVKRDQDLDRFRPRALGRRQRRVPGKRALCADESPSSASAMARRARTPDIRSLRWMAWRLCSPRQSPGSPAAHRHPRPRTASTAANRAAAAGGDSREFQFVRQSRRLHEHQPIGSPRFPGDTSFGWKRKLPLSGRNISKTASSPSRSFQAAFMRVASASDSVPVRGGFTRAPLFPVISNSCRISQN